MITVGFDPVDEELMDRSIVEECVPCHLMWLVAQGLVAEGVHLRNDVWGKLSRGAAAPLTHVRQDTRRVGRLARRVSEVGDRVLRQYSPASQEHGLYSASMFVLRLVDEGLLADTQNMAVLVSLLLLEELREASGGDVRVSDAILRADADRLLVLVRREGLYPGSVQVSSLRNTVPAARA